MKHIGKTNNNEVIVSLKIKDLNDLLMVTNAAKLYYYNKLEEDPDDIGANCCLKDSNRWWNIAYDLRETIKNL